MFTTQEEQNNAKRSLAIAGNRRSYRFYLDYLEIGNVGDFLPMALKSYLDGRLGKLEDRLSALSFKQSVEADRVVGIMADSFQSSEDDMRCRCTESFNNVKRTHGRISLEKHVREA